MGNAFKTASHCFPVITPISGDILRWYKQTSNYNTVYIMCGLYVFHVAIDLLC